LLHPFVYQTSAPFEVVVIDVISGFPGSSKGNTKILTMIDCFTSWPEAIPIPDDSTETIARFVYQEFICRYGVPKHILTDRGGCFISQLFRSLQSQLGCKSITSSSFHPQCHGKVETLNKYIIVQALSIYYHLHQGQWDEYLPGILFAYRTRTIEHLQSSPYQLLFGRNPSW
jgi:transposase InsO family protein